VAPAGGAGAGGDAWLLGLENRHASAHGLNGSNAQELVAIDVASTTRVQARAPDPPPSSRLLLQIANFRPDVFAIARLCGGQDMLLCATKQCPRQSNARDKAMPARTCGRVLMRAGRAVQDAMSPGRHGAGAVRAPLSATPAKASPDGRRGPTAEERGQRAPRRRLRGTRRVRLVRGEGRGVSTWYERGGGGRLLLPDRCPPAATPGARPPTHDTRHAAPRWSLLPARRPLPVLRGARLWCGVVWCGKLWCGKLWCGKLWCGKLFCAAARWDRLFSPQGAAAEAEDRPAVDDSTLEVPSP
jgi:hypothetical protein